MNALKNGEVATGAPNSLVREHQLFKIALKEIIKNKGMCIYGTADLHDASQEVKQAFREGSALAFNRIADLAERALNGEDVYEE